MFCALQGRSLRLVLEQRMILFLQHQQRCRLSQGLLLAVQFALQLHIGLLQFTYFLCALIAATAPADDAEVHAPLYEMMSKQTPFTTPRVQRFIDQSMTLLRPFDPATETIRLVTSTMVYR